MRLLTVSDEIVPSLHHPSVSKRLAPIDLILSCGDLLPSYVEYLVTLLEAPCYYVRGNHDNRGEMRESGGQLNFPRGCDNLDLRSVYINGLLLAGVEGSLRYNREGVQYSEHEMARRLWRLVPRMLLNKYRYGRYLDILITHAPPGGIHEGPGAHRGFRSLRQFIERYEPRYMIHGHVHLRYGYGDQSPVQLGRTTVINTCGYQILEIDPQALAADSPR